MDVVDFVRKYNRMCDNHDMCSGCPMDGEYIPCEDGVYKDPQGVIEIVEKWSKEHPVQTNWDKFKEVFGRAESGVTIYASAWWDAPYKAPKEDNK